MVVAINKGANQYWVASTIAALSRLKGRNRELEIIFQISPPEGTAQ
jgi:hypothetical protein